MSRAISNMTVLLVILTILSGLDVMQEGMRRRFDVYRIIAGTSRNVVGDLPSPLDEVYLLRQGTNRVRADLSNDQLKRYLVFTPSTFGLSMDFTEINGRMWRGVLTVSSDVSPGVQNFTVAKRGDIPSQRFTVNVFADAASYTLASNSFIERNLGIRSWIPLAAFMPGALLGFVVLGHLAARRDRELRARGIGAVLKVTSRHGFQEVLFSLGQDHGVSSGDRLTVVDDGMAPIGELTVARSYKNGAVGRVVSTKRVTRQSYVLRS